MRSEIKAKITSWERRLENLLYVSSLSNGADNEIALCKAVLRDLYQILDCCDDVAELKICRAK